ncbi:hypothetical protein NDU88_008072 [Pleurodeles waltl]|uniref:Uncharacterized protein n=1 Tax=Pleurodeles waltl TaxID=8319 RepID=A0AAV7QPR4_PLEWA|nr:hypothetical protein NDU88_008072 [Pleurodeles waltl]
MTVRTAVDVTAIFYLFTHLLPDLQQERTYTACAAVTCVWNLHGSCHRGKGPCLHRSGVGATGGWGPTPVANAVWASRPTGQRSSEKGYMACHRQGHADPGGLLQAEHPLSETVGGPETLGTEDSGSPAGDGLPMRKGCLSNPDPLMACMLAVAYPELDGCLGASQQTQGDE